MQLLLLTGSLSGTLLVGTGLVLVFFWLLGGRVVCGWICPVHLLTDLPALLPRRKHLSLWATGWKLVALAVVLTLSLMFGLPVFETVSPSGIAGRLYPLRRLHRSLSG